MPGVLCLYVGKAGDENGVFNEYLAFTLHQMKWNSNLKKFSTVRTIYINTKYYKCQNFIYKYRTRVSAFGSGLHIGRALTTFAVSWVLLLAGGPRSQLDLKI